MTQEQAEGKLNLEKPLQFFIRGLVVEDGDFKLDAAAGFSREDIAKEARRFLKYDLYVLTKDKNQNL